MPNIVNDWLITMPAGVNNPHGLIFSSGHWWVSFETSPGVVARIDPASPSTYSLITFAGHTWGMDLIENPLNGKVLVVWQGGAVVSEIDPTTLAWTDVISGT